MHFFSSQHAGSLEALRVTRPEAVVLGRNKTVPSANKHASVDNHRHDDD